MNPTWEDTTPIWEDTTPIENTNQEKPGLIKQAWDALKIPEQKSREGLTMLANMVPNLEPTGNLPMDLLKGTPRIAANTIAEAAPGFISRGAMLTAGAAKTLKEVSPLIKAAGRGVANQTEQITGAAPGAIRGAFNDATLMLSNGKKEAGALYDAAKAEIPTGTNIFKGMYKPQEIVDTAQEYLGKGGKLEPPEALMYRKALDKLMKSKNVVLDELIPMRQEADTAAKASENIAKADPLYNRGRMAESLRNLMPQNKYGGASAFKMGIITALENMGGLGKFIGAAMSPAVAGSAATVGGIATRAAAPVVTNPRASIALRNLLEEYIRRKGQASDSGSNQ